VPYRPVTVAGLSAIALRAGELELVTIPALGGKVSHLRRLDGREWLWRSDRIPMRAVRPDASYLEHGDNGGWDECFPNVAPGDAPGWRALPDHGELWSQPWDMVVTEHEAGVTLHGVVRCATRAVELRREITLLHDEPVAHAAYALRNESGEEMPWLWSAHPMFNTPPGTVVEIPELGQVRVDHSVGEDAPAANDVLAWKGAMADASGRFTMPEGGRWALKLFGDVPSERRVVMTEPMKGERLELELGGDVAHLGLWIEAGVHTTSDGAPVHRLALEPCLGAADALVDAIALGVAPPPLPPGGERRWSFRLRLPERD
jgi:galactose mutarotase-like enzyme